LDTIVFADVTVRVLLLWGGLGVGGLLLLGFVVRLFRAPPTSRHHHFVRCPQCGWTGQTSKFAGRCPKCNTALGDKRSQSNG
jgi:ssDNA-binding Zn-finger/Zn-ribbon topoisomerase 1